MPQTYVSQDPPSITTLINTDVESCVAPSALLNAPEAFDPPPIALVGEPTVLTGHTSCTCSSSTGVAVRTFRSLFTSPASNHRSDQDAYTAERLQPPLPLQASLHAWTRAGGLRGHRDATPARAFVREPAYVIAGPLAATHAPPRTYHQQVGRQRLP